MNSQFNFGSIVPSVTAPVSTAATTNAFGFGTPASTQSSVSLAPMSSFPTANTSTFQMGFGSNQMPTLGMNPNPTLTLTLTTAPTGTTPTSSQQTNAFRGLGGTQTTASESGADQSANGNKSSKESTFIPPEMMPSVEALKQFVKEQKEIREENSQQRFSIQPILEVASEIEDSLRVVFQKIEVDIQRNSKAIDSLKKETNRLLSSAEMAYRISRIDFLQTPSSYTIAQNKYINASTHQYFIEMVDNFELQMNNYSKQIQDLRTHIENMNKPYNSEELLQIMRKQHETLISLAAKVYAIHEDVNQLKLKLNNQSNYSTNLVESSSQSKPSSSSQSFQSFVGPNPFGQTGEEKSMSGAVSSGLHSTPVVNTQNTISGGNQSLFANITPNQPTLPTTTSQFMSSPLATTPSGSHSRAKRWTTS